MADKYTFKNSRGDRITTSDESTANDLRHRDGFEEVTTKKKSDTKSDTKSESTTNK